MSKEDKNLEEFSSSPLRVAAVGLHEMYTELRNAGFTRTEALRLVSDVMTAGASDGK